MHVSQCMYTKAKSEMQSDVGLRQIVADKR